MDKYDVVIGLEIHAELNTNTKVFCSCKNEFGSNPNENTCPVCTGLPGAIPILNKKAVEYAIKAGLCFNCDITRNAVFERKNYFYPDLSKAYQISQLENSFSKNGYVELSNKKIRLNRIQLEEDAGKLTHISAHKGSLIDYNRAGTPLIEIVTEPDFSSAEEVDEFLKLIRETLVFADIAKCKMEEGGMRCDVNISLKEKGAKEFGKRTEMKNLNSFKSIARAIEYEIERQYTLLEKGEKVNQQTRKWDDDLGENFSMRSKEDAQDYRYFSDPDLPIIHVSDEDISKIQATIPTLPYARRKKYIENYNLSANISKQLTETKYLSDYFNKCVEIYNQPTKIANWIITDLFKISNDKGLDFFEISEKHLTTIIKLVEDRKITKASGILLLNKVSESGDEPEELANKLNLISNITDDTILNLLKQLKDENQKISTDYKENPNKVVSFIIGYVMRNTQGKADNQKVKDLIPIVFK